MCEMGNKLGETGLSFVLVVLLFHPQDGPRVCRGHNDIKVGTKEESSTSGRETEQCNAATIHIYSCHSPHTPLSTPTLEAFGSLQTLSQISVPSLKNIPKMCGDAREGKYVYRIGDLRQLSCSRLFLIPQNRTKPCRAPLRLSKHETLQMFKPSQTV